MVSLKCSSHHSCVSYSFLAFCCLLNSKAEHLRSVTYGPTYFSCLLTGYTPASHPAKWDHLQFHGLLLHPPHPQMQWPFKAWYHCRLLCGTFMPSPSQQPFRPSPVLPVSCYQCIWPVPSIRFVTLSRKGLWCLHFCVFSIIWWSVSRAASLSQTAIEWKTMASFEENMFDHRVNDLILLPTPKFISFLQYNSEKGSLPCVNIFCLT